MDTTRLAAHGAPSLNPGVAPTALAAQAHAPTAHEAAVMAALRRHLPPDDAADAELADGVLSVKLGYNPNSSSVGSLVSVLFWSATGAAVLANLVAAHLLARRDTAPAPVGDGEASSSAPRPADPAP